MDTDSLVVALSDPIAISPDLGGAKAANIARCAAAGLPTLPGIVVTTTATGRGLDDPAVLDRLRSMWAPIGGSGAPLVVRSSSTIEDAGSSSMAGRFTSVLGVRGWESLLEAAARVVASGEAVRDDEGRSRPIAVLVQTQLDAEVGGVMFGVDPVTGETDHVVVEVVASGPEALVSGMATADHYVLSRRGRVLAHTSAAASVPLSGTLRRRLVGLAARAADVFGSPQDVEWAVDGDGRLWLLQSRPVTAVAEQATGRSVTLGPGPVAETFPEPLTRLESDLWIAPLREGIIRALSATGAVSDEAVARSPVVTTIAGRAAVDLGLLGLTSGHVGWRRRISPRAILRRLVAAWRVGRLRVALPDLAGTIIAKVDRDLSAIGSLDRYTDLQLLDLLHRSRDELATVHAYEVLAGMLLHDPEGVPPATLVALRSLHDGRAAGLSDGEIVAHTPIVLALAPPSLTRPIRMPADPPVPHGVAHGLAELGPRDGLRLRARWLQELQRRVVRLLDRRCVDAGTVPDAGLLAHLRLDELAAALRDGSLPADLAGRPAELPGPPLPTAFRLGVSGQIVQARQHRGAHRTGLAAGGGRGIGIVVTRMVPGATSHGPGGEGVVLVTQHLEPQLASLLPHLVGLISETGSALSHLAILAREMGVPTVAGVPGARQRFTSGMRVLVDGDTGEVEVLDAPSPPGAAGVAPSGRAA